jgi:hypothetical protein
VIVLDASAAADLLLFTARAPAIVRALSSVAKRMPPS